MYTIKFNQYHAQIENFTQFPVNDLAIKLFFFSVVVVKHKKYVSIIRINNTPSHSPIHSKKKLSDSQYRLNLDIFCKCTLFVIDQVYSLTLSKYMPLFPEASGQATGVLPNISGGHTMSGGHFEPVIRAICKHCLRRCLYFMVPYGATDLGISYSKTKFVFMKLKYGGTYTQLQVII